MKSGLAVTGLRLEVPGRRLLDDASFSVPGGTSLAVMGPSGVGKTSLLHCLAGIRQPAAGTVTIGATELTGLDSDKRAAFRLRHVGLVFQFGELLPELTVLENVSLPLRLARVGRREAEERAADWLNRLALSDLRHADPGRLSGGESQRVAIARAFVTNPVLILADEPTGALDGPNVDRVADLLVTTAEASNASVVVVTHNPRVAARADCCLQLTDGKLFRHVP